MNLQKKLSAYKADFIARVPSETVRIMKRATEELALSGILEKALKKGDPAPEFTLFDQNGKTQTVGQLLAKGPLVVSFYRGGW